MNEPSLGNAATPFIRSRAAQAFPVLTAAEVERLRRFGGRRPLPTASPGPGRRDRPRAADRPLRRGRDQPARRRPPPRDRHPRARLVHRRAGAAVGPAGPGRRRCARADGGAGDPARPAARPAGRRGGLGERIMRALILRRVGLIETGGGGPVIVGAGERRRRAPAESISSRRNGHPHQRLDPDERQLRADPDRALRGRARGAADRALPGRPVAAQSERGGAGRCIGLVGPIDPDRLFDVAVIGAGPAGLATSVYAGSEGLSVLVARLPLLRRPGGRVGADRELSRLSDRHFGHGADGPRVQPGAEVRRRDGDPRRGGEARMRRDRRLPPAARQRRDGSGRAPSVIATGARYRRLDVAELDAFEGTTVHYWASPLEAKLCAGQEVALVGGGNSAGQAVVFLAEQAGAGHPARPPAARRDHVGLSGRADRGPRQCRGRDRRRDRGARGRAATRSRRSAGATGAPARRRAARSATLLVHRRRSQYRLAGADPASSSTSAASSSPARRGHRAGCRSRPAGAACSRSATCAPGSVKRVAAAVGDGAQVVAALHAYLARLRRSRSPRRWRPPDATDAAASISTISERRRNIMRTTPGSPRAWK